VRGGQNARMRRGDSASLQQPGIGSSASKRAGALEHIAKSTGQSQEEDLYPSVSGVDAATVRYNLAAKACGSARKRRVQ